MTLETVEQHMEQVIGQVPYMNLASEKVEVNWPPGLCGSMAPGSGTKLGAKMKHWLKQSIAQCVIFVTYCKI